MSAILMWSNISGDRRGRMVVGFTTYAVGAHHH